MMGANLVGFVIGPDGTQYFVRAGIRSLFVARACLFGVTSRNITPMLTWKVLYQWTKGQDLKGRSNERGTPA